MSRARVRPGRRHWAILVGVVVLVAVVGQLALPRIAERVARDRLGDDGARVEIRTLPAWKLLLGQVDELRATTPTLTVTGDDLTALLQRARKVRDGRIEIGTLTVERIPIPIRTVVATLDRARVEATARIAVADLAAQLPSGAELRPASPDANGAPRLLASLTLLGRRVEVPIVVRARDGGLEAGADTGIASAIRVPLFANDSLRIDDLEGHVDGDELAVRIHATLR